MTNPKTYVARAQGSLCTSRLFQEGFVCRWPTLASRRRALGSFYFINLIVYDKEVRRLMLTLSFTSELLGQYSAASNSSNQQFRRNLMNNRRNLMNLMNNRRNQMNIIILTI